MAQIMRSTRRSEAGELLPDHEYSSWCDVIGCRLVAEEKDLETKIGEAYWKMLEETAKRVDTWPQWKKG